MGTDRIRTSRWVAQERRDPWMATCRRCGGHVYGSFLSITRVADDHQRLHVLVDLVVWNRKA